MELRHPSRRFNTLALICEKMGEEAMCMAARSIIPEVMDESMELYVTVSDGDPEHGWYFGNMSGETQKEIWYSERQFSRNIMAISETGLGKISYVAMLNAILSGMRILDTRQENDFSAAINMLAKNIGLPKVEFGIRLSDTDFPISDRTSLVVVDLDCSTEIQWLEKAIAQPRSINSTFLCMARNMDSFRKATKINGKINAGDVFIANAAIKLLDCPHLIPEENRRRIMFMDIGATSGKNMISENIKSEFWHAFAEKNTDRMIELSAIAIMRLPQDANQRFMENAIRFIRAWLPLAIHAYRTPEELKDGLSSRECALLARNGDIASKAGWEKMSRYNAMLGSLGWRWDGDDTKGNWTDQLGYIKGYLGFMR